jgi:hypothetical protein
VAGGVALLQRQVRQLDGRALPGSGR